MNRYKRFLRGLMIVTTGLILGSVSLLVTDRKQVPAKAQAQELFTLYFEMDHVRQDSAKIFAELMTVALHPERVGAAEAIGSKPPLASREELAGRLKENQTSVEQTLETIDADRFTDPEVDSRYDEVRTFYTTLFAFEDMVLQELSLAENNEARHTHLATILFEGAEWPALLAEDAHLRETLASLAELHGLEFAPLPYDNLFRGRLAELDTPLISDEVNTIVYPFTVEDRPTRFVLLNVTFDIPLSDKIKLTLEDPEGHIISADQLPARTDSAELNSLSYIDRAESVIFIKLFSDDPTVVPVPGDWKLYITAPVGCNMVIGMIQL